MSQHYLFHPVNSVADGPGDTHEPLRPNGNPDSTAFSPFQFGMFDKEDDAFTSQGRFLFHRTQKKIKWPLVLLWLVLGGGVMLCLVLACIALGMSAEQKEATDALRLLIKQQQQQQQQQQQGQPPQQPPAPSPGGSKAKLISKIAFGSCSSYDLRPQTIWQQGVIPSDPDAWIWVGDMAYLDDPVVSCAYAPQLCNCTLSWIKANPNMCMAGNFSHGRDRMMAQLHNPEYRSFLEFMCPGAMSKGLMPPPGSNRNVCPRPVLGVYDDHDFGWNNGNGRLPNKDQYKELFLDALGEPADSPRRGKTCGLQDTVVLNEGVSGKEIQVILLDERYDRETLPCQMRREWCQAVLGRPGPPDPWCQDFLNDDGATGAGSCCFKDEQVKAWCGQADSASHPFFRPLCDPTAREFGSQRVVLTNNSTDTASASGAWQVLDAGLSAWQDPALEGRYWRWLTQESSFCDVLGRTQWDWLRSQLSYTSASGTSPALRLVVSGSVPFGSLGWSTPASGGLPPLTCSSDDWACYNPAQVHLLHTLANATGSGCVVVLTGDYHFADLKMVQPGTSSAYSSILQTQSLNRTVYQVMSSGMSDSTAHGAALTCPGQFSEDLVGLRPQGRCAYTPMPNFGIISVDWDKQVLSLEIRDASSGNVAASMETVGKPLKLDISLNTCQLV